MQKSFYMVEEDIKNIYFRIFLNLCLSIKDFSGVINEFLMK